MLLHSAIAPKREEGEKAAVWYLQEMGSGSSVVVVAGATG
jgi:hypothetical protein